MLHRKLVEKYLLHEKAYWQEIAHQLNGPLSTKAHLFPDFYRYAGNLLIFPAGDGLVAACFDQGFSFGDPHFDKWLSFGEKDKGPSCSIITTSLSKRFSIAQWVQVLTGNGMKFILNDIEPPNVNVKGKFPQFPPITIHDPASGTTTPTTTFRLCVEGSISDFGMSLREATIEEVETGKKWSPFLWRQLAIYGENAIHKLTNIDGTLSASRELNAIIGSINLGLDPKSSSDPYAEVIKSMSDLIAEFIILLDNERGQEENLHEFLKGNPILLAPDYIGCLSKPSLGSEYKPDFIITQPSDYGEKCTLVEIEHASHDLFTRNNEPRSELNHGLSQIRDWRQWLRQHPSYGQDSLGLPNLHADCQALLIIGKRSKLNPTSQKKLEGLALDTNHLTTVLTYDDVLDRVTQWNENLKEMARLRG